MPRNTTRIVLGRLSADEREAGLKRTVILCINQKLRRMSVTQLGEILIAAEEIVEREKKATRSF